MNPIAHRAIRARLDAIPGPAATEDALPRRCQHRSVCPKLATHIISLTCLAIVVVVVTVTHADRICVNHLCGGRPYFLHRSGLRMQGLTKRGNGSTESRRSSREPPGPPSPLPPPRRPLPRVPFESGPGLPKAFHSSHSSSAASFDRSGISLVGYITYRTPPIQWDPLRLRDR